MGRNDEIEAGAKAIAKDFELPGGRRTKLARVVARHLGWFETAVARGMTWDDMIAVLAVAGARRPNGLPLSRGTLSSTVWRKRSEVAADKTPSDRPPVGRRASDRAQSKSRSGPSKPAGSRAKQTSKKAVPRVGKKSRRNVPEKSDVQHSTKALYSTERERRAGADNQLDARAAGSDVLAFMKRAAKLRQHRDDG